MLAGLSFLLFVPRDTTTRLQLAYAQVFRWPLAAGHSLTQVSRPTQVRTVSSREYEKLLKDWHDLRNGSANLKAQLRDANQRIEQLTKLRAKPAWERVRLVPASIITPVGQGGNELIINQGKDNGVAAGQYVMSLQGDDPNNQCIIGTISDVYARAAKIKLITHTASRIPVSVGDLHVSWFLEGRGNGTARIALVPDKYTIRKGDVVYAETSQGFLDVPVVAGEVLECRRDPDRPVVWEITVRPVCDVAGLSGVVVISPTPRPAS
jgi:cell shape-determining protein MreC